MMSRFKVGALIVPLLLSSAFIFLGTRQNDQIALVFDYVALPDSLVLLFIAVAAGLALKLIALEKVGDWKVIRELSFAAPAIGLMIVWLYRGAWLLALIALIGVLVQLGLSRRIRGPRGDSKLALAIAGGAVLAWISIYIAVTLSPVGVPRYLGAATLTFMFLSFVAIGCQTVFRFPLFLAPLFGLVVAAFFFHEREHRIELTEFALAGGEGDPSESVRSQASLQQAFATWLLSRNDLDEYRRRKVPYPVFLVASQGGGGYAAAHADLFLSKVQSSCPNFAQHLFAAVGVSGGAVGNAMFMARLPDETNHDSSKGCQTGVADERLLREVAADNLSPILAALYFRDFPNKILFGVFGGLDRSSAFKSSIVTTLADANNVDPLSWDQYWKTTIGVSGWQLGEHPALVAVATNATSGRRYVFAPFSFSFPNGRIEEALLNLNKVGMHDDYHSADVHVLDAAIASASFPYVTPSRMLEGTSLVDGGYIENDGAETARDILAELQSPNPYFDGATIVEMRPPSSYIKKNGVTSCESPQLEYVPVSVLADQAPEYSGDEETDRCRILFSVHVISIRSEVPTELEARAQNFFSDPIVSLLSARSRRGETARFALLSQLCGAYNCPPQVEDASGWRLYESVIRTDELTLPLGWYLPLDRVTALSNCVAPDPNEEFLINDAPVGGGITAILEWQSNEFSTMRNNPYAVGQIHKALNPNNVDPIDPKKTIPGRCSPQALSEDAQ